MRFESMIMGSRNKQLNCHAINRICAHQWPRYIYMFFCDYLMKKLIKFLTWIRFGLINYLCGYKRDCKAEHLGMFLPDLIWCTKNFWTIELAYKILKKNNLLSSKMLKQFIIFWMLKKQSSSKDIKTIVFWRHENNLSSYGCWKKQSSEDVKTIYHLQKT